MTTTARPAWYKPDRGLGFRMLVTMFLLGAVYIVFGFIMWQIGYGILFIPLAIIIAVIQLFFADKIALKSMRAHEVTEAQQPQLHDMVGRLAAQANLPKPKIYLVDSSVPNAFATGRNKNNAVLAVTSGLLSQLPEPELEAVVAHELTHIINRDMLVMTIATFFAMVLSLLMNNLLWMSMFGGMGMGGMGRGGRGRGNSGGAIIMLIVMVTAVTYFLSFLLIRLLSRYRELAADRGSALITGAPQNLASALMRIDGTIQHARIPDQDFRQAQTVNALFIVPALRRGSGGSMATIFSTHPSTEERVERLTAMQRYMESQNQIH
ncbi:MAG: zinc metalloprotease HtpX [Ktedonobacterales bacterium]